MAPSTTQDGERLHTRVVGVGVAQALATAAGQEPDLRRADIGLRLGQRTGLVALLQHEADDVETGRPHLGRILVADRVETDHRARSDLAPDPGQWARPGTRAEEHEAQLAGCQPGLQLVEHGVDRVADGQVVEHEQDHVAPAALERPTRSVLAVAELGGSGEHALARVGRHLVRRLAVDDVAHGRPRHPRSAGDLRARDPSRLPHPASSRCPTVPGMPSSPS